MKGILYRLSNKKSHKAENVETKRLWMRSELSTKYLREKCTKRTDCVEPPKKTSHKSRAFPSTTSTKSSDTGNNGKGDFSLVRFRKYTKKFLAEPATAGLPRKRTCTKKLYIQGELCSDEKQLAIVIVEHFSQENRRLKTLILPIVWDAKLSCREREHCVVKHIKRKLLINLKFHRKKVTQCRKKP